MKLIFGTTNNRKLEDLLDIIKSNKYDIDVLTLKDIDWNLGEINETGNTLEENSLLKAKAIYDFCKSKDINYPILTDDAGLFVEALNGEPGVYTGRYANYEISLDPSLPKYECINKLLRKLEGIDNRNAYYRCVVTCMYSDGSYFQESSISNGTIGYEINAPIKKPYFYSIFILNNTNKTFNQLNTNELKNTYRYEALENTLKLIKK